MPFIALKGWNFHTQEYDTLEEYFNPTINPYYNLTPRAYFKDVESGLKKVFPPSMIEEKFLLFSDHTQLTKNLTSRLIHTDSIPTATKLSMRVYELTEIADAGAGTQQTIYVDVIHYAKQSGRVTSLGANKRIVLTDQTEDALYEEILEHITSAINHVYEVPETDPRDVVVDVGNIIWFQLSFFSTLWKHHFNRTRWTQVFRGPNLGPFIRWSDEGTTYAPQDVVSLMRLNHRDGRELSIYLHPADFDPENLSQSSQIYPCLAWVEDPNDRSRLYRTQPYATNVTSILRDVLREEGEEAEILYGVELEVATSAGNERIIDAPDKLYCIAKQDSSITGGKPNKIEIVSAPATRQAHKKYWHQILDKVGYNEFDCTKSTNNGMHVHIDLKAFNGKYGRLDTNHQKQFIWFFTNPVHRDFQVAVSERDPKSADTWMYSPKFPKDWPLPQLYRNLMSYVFPPYRGIINFKQDRNGQYITLEVRAFKGLVSLATISKNLDFVDSVFHFTSKAFYQSNTIDRYLQYINSLPVNKYSILREFLSRIDTSDFVTRSQLHQLLWGVNNPEKIKYLVEKHHPLPLNPAHLDVLNSLIPNVKFGFSRKNELTVIETNRAALSDLDRGLHEKFARHTKKGGQANVSHHGS